MYPGSSLLQFVKSGKAWTADTALQGLTLNQYLRFKASNPSNSGKVVYIYNFGNYVSSITGTPSMKVNANPSTNITTNTVTPRSQNLANTDTPALTVAWDTNVSDVSGGTLYRTIPYIGGDWKDYNRDIIAIYPGQSISLSVQALVAASAILHLSWIEEPQT